MNKKLPIPPGIPEGFEEKYRGFTLAQIIQQLMVDHGCTIADVHRTLGFLLARAVWQLEEPEAIMQMAQSFSDNYARLADMRLQSRAADPVVKLRQDAQSAHDRRATVSKDYNRELVVDLSEDTFMREAKEVAAGARKEVEPSRIILQ